MPSLRIREVRIPELRLPEMSREDITRVIGDVTRDIDLTKLDPRGKETVELELPKVDLTKIELPKVRLSAIDLPKAIAAVDLPKAIAAVSPLRRQARRPRAPFIIGGLITLGIVGYALMTSPTVRPKLTSLGQRIRAAIDERRAAMQADRSFDTPHAFDAAVAVPVQPSAYTDSAPTTGSPLDGPSDLPEGLGADAGTVSDETTGFEVRAEA